MRKILTLRSLNWQVNCNVFLAEFNKIAMVIFYKEAVSYIIEYKWFNIQILSYSCRMDSLVFTLV